LNNQDSRLPEPFDSFVVGSLPRPKWVMEVVESRKRGDISDKNFQSILDSAVPFAITLQEKAGLNYITDGEWRRESYVKVFSDSVDGFKNDLIGVGTVNQNSHTTNMYPAVVNKIKQIKSIALNEAKFTMRHSFGGSKLLVTLPSAYTIGRRMWDEKFSSKTYPDRAEFIEDCVPIIRKEIFDLIDAGFLNIQLDDPWLALLVDPEYRKREKISDIDKEIELSVRSTNKIIKDFDSVFFSVHLCHAHYNRLHGSEGPYDLISDAFDQLNVDRIAIELASPVAGGLNILKTFPSDKILGMGVVDHTSRDIEKSDSIVSKVEDAINYLGSDKITLNPDCGFAPSSSNPMDLDEAYLKLKELSSASVYLKNKYL